LPVLIVGFLVQITRARNKRLNGSGISAPLIQVSFVVAALVVAGAAGGFSLEALEQKLFELGLRSKAGKKVSDSVLSRLLGNPFYTGVIRIKKTGETYLGIHEGLISKDLFDRVQRTLNGRYSSGTRKHQFLFRRFITCTNCGYSLIPERQKGHVYYRCQTKSCPTKTIREEEIDRAFRTTLDPLRLRDREMKYLKRKFEGLSDNFDRDRQIVIAGIELQKSKARERLNRLTDAYLEGALDKETFEERKTALVIERRDLEDKLVIVKQNEFSIPERLQNFLELAKTASLAYEVDSPEKKRRLLEKLTSNRKANRKSLEITLAFPFSDIAKRFEDVDGRPSRSTARIWDGLLAKIIAGLHSSTTFNSSQQ
jgi:site-specific DNA recombinase